MLEPDLGTTMVLCAIFVAVYFAAGAEMAAHLSDRSAVF
jgi:cell division protein FtsW (lipid II flippase)